MKNLFTNKISEATGLNSDGVKSTLEGINGLIKGDNDSSSLLNLLDGVTNLSCPLGA